MGFLIHIEEIDLRVKQKNRKHWKLKEMLPKDELAPVTVIFHMPFYPCSWMHRSGFVDLAHFRQFEVLRSSEWFEVEVDDLVEQGSEFEVRVGIARKSGKEMVVSDAEVISPRKSVAFIRLIRRSELRKMIQSYKELEFFVVIDEKVEEREKNKKNLDMQKFRTDYEELFLSSRNSDFTIHVKGVKFDVHRSILGARSPVFSAMMEHDMAEKRNGEVTLVDADPDVFQQFLLFLYTGDEHHINGTNLAELYKLGDKYCVEDLRNLCVERMKTMLSIDNFFQFFPISQQLLPHSELSEIVIQFFLEDSKEIVGSEKHIEFMKKHPKEATVLMKALEANK